MLYKIIYRSRGMREKECLKIHVRVFGKNTRVLYFKEHQKFTYKAFCRTRITRTRFNRFANVNTEAMKKLNKRNREIDEKLTYRY